MKPATPATKRPTFPADPETSAPKILKPPPSNEINNSTAPNTKAAMVMLWGIAVPLQLYPTTSYHDRLLVLAIYPSHGVGDFAHGGAGLHRLDDRGHQVAGAARGVFHLLDRGLPLGLVTSGAQ